MHIPVLLHEAIEGLDIHPGETFVDATLGNGGHSEEVAKTFGDTVAMIGIDLDPDALFRSKTRLAPLNPNIRYAEGSFRNIDDILKKFGVSKADKILFDLGWSSEQFAASGRGFSFQIDEPLLMTFGKVSSSDSSANITAWQIVNEWDEENIATILSGYGEERFAKPIARAIVRARKLRSIDTTAELVCC
jgi:16S rRNA (cytosine1402-N4)-methyltransferase